MREILFRGKDVKERWHIGLLSHIGNAWYISNSAGIPTACEVIPSTIGEYTGLRDKNGKRIFEGDIVKNDWCYIKGNAVVRFGPYKMLDEANVYQCGHLGFYLDYINNFNKKTMRKDIMFYANKCEIIGNVFDNPELLKEG